MAKNLGVLVLSILVCKIQSQAIEVNTNLQYSQFSFPPAYPSFIQTAPSAQPVSPNPVPVPLPSPPPKPVALPPQQYLPSTVPVTLPAQPFLSAPVNQPPPLASVTLPTQPQISPPTVNFPSPISIPVPQPILQPNPIQPPTAVTFPAPLPTFQVSPPPPIPLFPPSVHVSSPPPIAIQELPVSVNVPTVIPSIPTLIPSPVVMSPSQIPMISTTVVDNSLANKLANVLQLYLASRSIKSNVNPYCNSPFFSDVTPFYDAIGTIGTIYSPVTEVVTAPFYSPAYGLSDIVVPSIFGESFGTVAEVSPFGEYLTYSTFATELLLPTQLAYNFPQIDDPALEQLVYY